MEWRQPIILGCVGLYMLACVLVGIWAMRRTKSVGDFFVAGRRLGVVVTAVAIFSSLISGFTFVGGPGLIYHMGLTPMWMAVGLGIGGCLSVMLISKRLRMVAEVRDTLSLPDAVAARYGSELSRGLTAVAILLGVMGYLATQILAMATVLKTLLEDSQLVDAIPLEFCVVISCAVLVFYCTTGGIIAGVYTDLFQGAIMVVACVFIFVTARNAFEGGFTAMAETIAADDREAIGPWGSAGMLAGLSWLFLFALGACGQPHVLTKHMMFRRMTDIRGILVVSVIAGMFSILLVLGIGMAMRALVVGGRLPPLDNPDAAAPVFLQTFANPLLAGIVFAGLFAAVMSTADSFLNVGTAAIVHDLPRAIRGRGLRSELFWARVSTVIVALAAAVFGLYSGDLVALLGAFGWGTFAAALVPAVAVGFNWKRATATAVNVTIVFSLIMNFTLRLADVRLPWGIDGGALTLFLSLAIFFSISLLSRPPRLAPDIEEIMEL